MRSLLRLASIGLISGILSASSAQAQTPPPFEMPKQFSTDIESTAGGMKSLMKIYVDGDKSRTEIDAMGNTIISIGRGDLKVVYTLMPAQKQYMEMPMTEQQLKTSSTGIDPNAKWESLGTETVNGKQCDKYRVTTVSPADPKEQIVSIFYIESATKIPVRTITGDGPTKAVLDYKNFQKTAPDASLFEPPKDYTKFALPNLQRPPQNSIPAPTGQ